MEMLILSTCAAVLIALFTLLRIPLNRWTVPSASIAGILLVFGLIQVLNYYHPHSPTNLQLQTSLSKAAAADGLAADVSADTGGHNMVAWFHRNSLLRLGDGSAAEVAFDHIPGKVFSGRVESAMTMPRFDPDTPIDFGIAADGDRVPVIIEISDPRFETYSTRLPPGYHAQAAVYGEDFRQLALVRKTLLRMSAWMNYLTPLS